MKIVASGGPAPAALRMPRDRFAIEFSGVEKPNVLYIATPKATPETLQEANAKALSHFADLGTSVDVLYTEFDTPPSKDEIAHKIGRSSVVNVSGGDTLRAVERFKLWGIDDELRTAANNGTVLSGVSAGAISWFTKGHSDSMAYRAAEGEPWEYMMVDALDLEPGIIVPHYNTRTPGGEPRKSNFAKMISSVDVGSLPIYGIDNRAALVVDGPNVAGITVDDTHRVHVISPDTGLPYGVLDTL